MTLLLVLALLGQPAADCGDEAGAALANAAARRARGGVQTAASVLVQAMQATPRCVTLGVASWASIGWLEARLLAPKGGAPEEQGATRAALDALESLGARGVWRVQNDYARAAITAAVAAAQEERGEMSVYLTHARGLADRLTLAGERAEWPLPIDLLEGELWFEVDRFAEARDAYTRAAGTDPQPAAFIGLARSQTRLGERAAACAAFRTALEHAEDAWLAEARAYLAAEGCSLAEGRSTKSEVKSTSQK